MSTGSRGMAVCSGYEPAACGEPGSGERVLFPAVRAAGEADFVVAPGFSCRHQIADFCDGRGAVSTAELVAMAG